jgi:hypothetical protein
MTTNYHSQYWAHALTLKSASDSVQNLSRSIANARVDLNPHQVDAALFAFRLPLAKGAILADEVGLGKTIEAGIVSAQSWAEGCRRILLILPATLRKQWHQEMEEKFFLPTLVLESRNFNQMCRNGHPNPFDQPDKIIASSYQFASATLDASGHLRRLRDLGLLEKKGSGNKTHHLPTPRFLNSLIENSHRSPADSHRAGADSHRIPGDQAPHEYRHQVSSAKRLAGDPASSGVHAETSRRLPNHRPALRVAGALRLGDRPAAGPEGPEAAGSRPSESNGPQW